VAEFLEFFTSLHHPSSEKNADQKIEVAFDLMYYSLIADHQHSWYLFDECVYNCFPTFIDYAVFDRRVEERCFHFEHS
jgi:hypothetical protein